MKCVFITTDVPGTYVCSNPGCTNKVTRAKNPPELVHAECQVGRPAPPPSDNRSFVAKLRRYGAAKRRWVEAGRPMRTPERVIEIFDALCSPCENFTLQKDGKGKCALCGCGIKRASRGMNKLDWATEACPVGKWAAEVFSGSTTERVHQVE